MLLFCHMISVSMPEEGTESAPIEQWRSSRDAWRAAVQGVRTESDTAGRVNGRRRTEADDQMEVTVSRRQIKTLKASHRPRTCRHPSVAGSGHAERVGSCWASWPMPVWADLRLLCGQPEPGPYAAPSAPWQVEVWLFASWEDDKRTERASHEACGESSCRRGDTPRIICRVLNPASKSSAASSQRWTPDSPPAVKPGAPFCCLGAACEGFLGCGYGLSRAAVSCSRLGRGDRLPFPGCESGTGGFWKLARERPARPSPGCRHT